MKPGQSYPSSIIQTINSVIKECAASSGLYPTQANPSMYLTYLFDYGEDYYIPENAFQCIWYNLIQFQQLGKQDWIKSYWESAVCHANLHLAGYFWQRLDNSTGTPKECLLFRFQEFHQMYCGYLLFKKEYELLKHLRNYSNSSPYVNSLVECDFIGVCQHLEHISQPMYMDTHYSFYTILGVKESVLSKRWYLIYMLMGCLVYPNTSMDLDVYDLSLYKLTVYERIIDELIHTVKNDDGFKGMISDLHFQRTFDLKPEAVDNMIGNLNSLLKSVQSEIAEKKENEPIIPDNIDNYKNTVNSLVVKSIETSNLPVKYNDIEVKTIDDKLEIPTQSAPRNYFSDEQLIAYVNLPESYATYIIRLIDITYTGKFKLNSPRVSFIIDYSEITQALNALGVDKSYSIISFGVSITEDLVQKVDTVHFVNGQNAEIIVIPKKEVPYLSLLKRPVNIRISENKKHTEEMKIEGSIPYKYEQEHFIHYVKLRVVFRDYQGIPSQLSKIQRISNYF